MTDQDPTLSQGDSIEIAGDNYLVRTNGVSFLLSGKQVERVVLAKAELNPGLLLDGTIAIFGDGLSENVIEIAINTGYLQTVRLSDLTRKAIHMEFLDTESDAQDALSELRTELEVCLRIVDRAARDLREWRSKPPEG
jgi:hypothetical protein